jgi:hypothetical protein
MTFRPYFFAEMLGIEERHLAYLLGAALFAAIYAVQKLRIRGSNPPVAA